MLTYPTKTAPGRRRFRWLVGLLGRIICNHAIFPTYGKAYDLVSMTYAIPLHSWRTSRHTRHGDPNQIISL